MPRSGERDIVRRGMGVHTDRYGVLSPLGSDNELGHPLVLSALPLWVLGGEARQTGRRGR